MSMNKIGNYPGASGEGDGGRFTFKSTHISSVLVLVVLVEFSLVKLVFVANIQFFQQYLNQLKVSKILPQKKLNFF